MPWPFTEARKRDPSTGFAESVAASRERMEKDIESGSDGLTRRGGAAAFSLPRAAQQCPDYLMWNPVCGEYFLPLIQNHTKQWPP